MPKDRDDKTSPESQLIEKLQQTTSGLSDQKRGYLAIACGLFLCLFAIGYFQFLTVLIGLLGFAMVVWGTIESKIIVQLTAWFNRLLKK